MSDLILQRVYPLLVALAMVANSIGGVLGFGQLIPYNPERTDVVVSGDVSTDINKIVETYNTALQKSDGLVVGKSSAEFVGDPVVEFEGMDEEVSQMFTDILKSAYKDNAEKVFAITGNAILSSDVEAAKMSSHDGVTSIIINIKDFIGDINDVDNGVSRAFGYTDTSDFFEEGDITISYTNCVIACRINEKSGKIIYADFDNTGEIKGEDIENVVGNTVVIIDKLEFTLVSHIDI
ncbi:MAG: hypothetical protein IKK85_03930 [Clostridia bacterium]|nr:hypothetical protein [Clostridia bacterium]